MVNKKTRKVYSVTKSISGKIIEEKEGWKSIFIYGTPFERGYAHGTLLHKEITYIKKIFPFMVRDDLGVTMKEYLHKTKTLIEPKVKHNYPEYYEEMQGIVKGVLDRGTQVTFDFILGWNAYLSLSDYFGYDAERCSAFIATGKATQHGRIVMAHNTHCSFVTASTYNIVIHVQPTNGHPFFMQTSAGLICSTTDWFITQSGIMGCESTIGGINYKPKYGDPFFCRIRQVMQYANTLDDCIIMMKQNNAGDYASSWLFGDTKTDEIMLFELGLKQVNIKRTKNGVFYGMNSVIGDTFRKKETNDTDLTDIKTSSGNRNKRFKFLLNTKYKGKINLQNARDIISDHYDEILQREMMNGKTICSHVDLDPCSDEPFYPWGAIDAKITDSAMTERMQFHAIFGSACGKRDFKAKTFCKENPRYKYLAPYLTDLTPHKWTLLTTMSSIKN